MEWDVVPVGSRSSMTKLRIGTVDARVAYFRRKKEFMLALLILGRQLPTST